MTRSRGERAIYGAILLGALLIAAGLVAQQLASLILATMLTIIISLPMSVSAERLAPLGVPRALGALIGLLTGIAVVAGALVLLLPPLIDQGRTLVTDAPHLIRAAEIKVSSVTGDRPGHVAAQLQHNLTTFVRDPSQLLGPITTIGASVATIVGGVVIGVITAYYIAAQPEPLTRGLLSLFSTDARPRAAATLTRIRAAWLGWLRGLAASMVLIGVMLYVALGLVVGLPFALVFAVLSACAEVVPYLGALASGIPPVAFALTISPDAGTGGADRLHPRPPDRGQRHRPAGHGPGGAPASRGHRNRRGGRRRGLRAARADRRRADSVAHRDPGGRAVERPARARPDPARLNSWVPGRPVHALCV